MNDRIVIIGLALLVVIGLLLLYTGNNLPSPANAADADRTQHPETWRTGPKAQRAACSKRPDLFPGRTLHLGAAHG